MAEVFEHEDDVVVMLDVPAVGEGAIAVTVEGEMLVVKVTDAQRPYQREVPLPCAVDADGMVVTRERNMLHITLPKAR